MNLNPDEPTKDFTEGVQYALNYLEDVFGEEVKETDLWKEYFREEASE